MKGSSIKGPSGAISGSPTHLEGVVAAWAAAMTRKILTGYPSGTAANAMSSTPLEDYIWMEPLYFTTGGQHKGILHTHLAIRNMTRSTTLCGKTRMILRPIARGSHERCKSCLRIYEARVMKEFIP